MGKEDKLEAQDKIKNFFENLENKKPEDIKKIKRLAMTHNIKLKGLRKKFCKKCYNVFNSKNSETRISHEFKIIKCKCGNMGRWKIKS